MPVIDNFYQIRPEDRFAERVFKQIDRCMEATGDDEYLKCVNKLEAMIWAGTDNPESDYLAANEKLRKAYAESNNSFALANDRLKLLMLVIDSMGFTRPETVITAISPKIRQDKNDVVLHSDENINSGKG